MLTLFAAAVTLMGGPDTPMPGTPVNGPSAVSWPFGSGLIDTGIKTTSDSYTDGHFSITAPIFSDVGKDGTLGGNVVFLEPYISWGEQGEVATSLGLGFRHLFNQQPLTALQQPSAGLLAEGLMLGGNVFLDMLDTQTDNRFWQLGFGLEVATRYLELRANYYQPLTGRQEGEPILQREVQRGTFLTSGKEPFATGHTIQQDVTFTTYDFYTDYLYRTYEEGLEGWDAEAALLMPGLDQWCELWLIGGYGSFENKPFGPQLLGTGEVAGWKAGVEFRPVPQMVLSATWFEDERLSGGEWLYGLSLQLPLDPEPSNTSKSWWRKLKDTLRPRSRHLAERSAVPVHRQNAAIKVGNSISEPEVTQYTKVVSEVEKRVVVRDDVIFVNNGGAQGNGIAAHGAAEDGTAERPYDTIQEGVDLSATAGYQAKGVPTVYVAGTPYTYDQDGVQVYDSVSLTSGGFGVGAYAGQRFGQGILAQLPSGLKADLTGQVSLEINGFDLGGIEIRGDGKQNIFIRGNRIGIHQGDTPITTFYVEEIGDITVVVNTIGGDPSASGGVFASGVGGGSANFSFNASTVAMTAYDFLNATFIGNRVVAFDGGISVTASSSIVIQSNDIRIIGSLRGTGEEGIGITAVSRNGSLAKLTLSDNRVVLNDSHLDANSSGISIAGQVLFDSSYGNEVISLGRNPNSATLTIIRAFQNTLWFGGSVEINGAELRFGAPQMADSIRWF